MQDKVLVPVDGTESFDETLAYVQALTPQARTEIVLLHVLPADTTPEVAAINCSQDGIHDKLQKLYTALRERGWTVSAELRMGDPVEEIVKMAVLLPAAVVFLSTHGRTGLERISKGSVTESVVRQCPCPSFILHSTRPEPPDQRREQLFRRILVPLDGTDDSSAILPCVEKFAKSHDSEVVIFHDQACDGPTGNSENDQAVKRALQDQSVELANKGLVVTLDMSTYRRPIREILNKIDERDIDLVAMVSHGLSGNRRALEESVTADVIRHSNCPLLVWSASPQCPTYM